MAKNKKKRAKRIVLFTIICSLINGYIILSMFSIFKDVKLKKEEKEELTLKLSDLKEETESLKVEANKLQDKDYIGKYAREKFLYSGKNEYILKIKW